MLQNTRVIKNAFKTLRSKASVAFDASLHAAMPKAYEEGMSEHNSDMRLSHVREPDSIGYVITHDGQTSVLFTNEGRVNEAKGDTPSARAELQKVAQGHEGYYACMLSVMSPPTYFETVYETDMYNGLKPMVKEIVRKVIEGALR